MKKPLILIAVLLTILGIYDFAHSNVFKVYDGGEWIEIAGSEIMPSVEAVGDGIYSTDGSSWTVAPKGNDNDVWTMNGNIPNWEAAAAGGLSVKFLRATRDMTAASGDVEYTGVGFEPTAIIAWGGINVSFDEGMSVGGATGTTTTTDMLAVGLEGSNVIISDAIVKIESQFAKSQTAVLKSFDADGFTLTWTKDSTPTGTATLGFLCLK